jgi:hypothetical protein
MPCSVAVGYQRLGGLSCPHLHLKAWSSETSVSYLNTKGLTAQKVLACCINLVVMILPLIRSCSLYSIVSDLTVKFVIQYITLIYLIIVSTSIISIVGTTF